MAQTIDPVGAGNIVSLARPGGNVTGFAQFEYNLAGKWLELLKEIAPRVRRVGVLRDPGAGAGIGQWAVIQAFSPALGIELRPINVRSAADIEREVKAFASEPDSGLITVVSGASQIHRELIVSLAARHKLPTVYPYRFFTTGGGLGSGPIKGSLVCEYVIHGLRQEAFDESRLFLANGRSVFTACPTSSDRYARQASGR